MRSSPKAYASDEDIRYEYRVMVRWCRLFRRSAQDWVRLEAERFRARHPIGASTLASAA